MPQPIYHEFVMKPPIPPAVTEASIEAAKASALDDLRAGVVVMAAAKGHTLGRWHNLEEDGEVAYCRNCWRGAMIDMLRAPHFAGPAISEGCWRPDAFLASQHESVTRRVTPFGKEE